MAPILFTSRFKDFSPRYGVVRRASPVHTQFSRLFLPLHSPLRLQQCPGAILIGRLFRLATRPKTALWSLLCRTPLKEVRGS